MLCTKEGLIVEEPATGGGGMVGWSLGFCSPTEVKLVCFSARIWYHQEYHVNTLPSFVCHLDMNLVNRALYTADKVELRCQPCCMKMRTYHHHKLNALSDNFDRLHTG